MAAHIVNEAREHAEQLVAAARRHADHLRAEAAEAAERMTADARQQVAVLQVEIERLRAARADAEARSTEGPRRSTPRAGWRRPAALAVAVLVLAAAGAWLLRGRASMPSRVARTAAAPEVTTAAAPAPKPSAPASAPAAVAAARVSVEIRAARNAWLRVGADGVMPPGGFIRAGQRRSLTGDREVELRTADAGALLVSVNGAPEASLGSNGAVLTRRWTLDESKPDVAQVVDADKRPRPVAREATVVRPVPRTDSVAPTGVTGAVTAEPGRVRQQIVESERRWFEALYRHEQRTLDELQAAEFELADQRPESDRPAAGASVERLVRTLQVDTWGDNAVVSGLMTERVSTRGGREVDSVFAETWVRRDGRWQLMGVRLNTPAQNGAATKH